jgi:hypothetical protein
MKTWIVPPIVIPSLIVLSLIAYAMARAFS